MSFGLVLEFIINKNKITKTEKRFTLVPLKFAILTLTYSNLNFFSGVI